MTTTPADPDFSADVTDDETADDAVLDDAAEGGEPVFRLGYVPGATPAKWARVWRERLPQTPLALVQLESADVPRALVEGDADAVLGRLPVNKDVMHAIALYDEVAVVVASRDHTIAALEETDTVTLADLADEVVQHPLDDVLWIAEPRPGQEPYERAASTKEAVAVVAAGVGVLIVPKSLARLHRRKDTVYREISDGPIAPVGLVWPRDSAHELVEEIVGIVRGRTAQSSRGRVTTEPEPAVAAIPGKKGASAASAQGSGKGAVKGSSKGSGSKPAPGKSSRRGGSSAAGRIGGRSAAAKRAAQGKKAKRQGN